ncbi:MAG: hypothetical protein U5R49_04455 [Deltaproteobacteria bacterium]|nr:hypothetical protein [Deltaproteobacteria bacterium]
MAAGLAVRIKEVFGITPQLMEGHNGIYEVTINGEVAATNQGKCTAVPGEDDIVSVIRKSISPLPEKEKMVKTVLPMA